MTKKENMRKLIKKGDKPRVLLEGKYLRLIRWGGWEYAQRNNCTGIVVVIALTADGKVILTRQWRPPVKKDVIEFPAGLVNDNKDCHKNESMALAAQRELLEETGYQAQRMKKILTGPVSAGFSSDLISIYLASGLTKKTDGGGDATENIRTYTVPLAHVERWLKEKMRQGCLIDPKVYAGLYFLYRASIK